MHAARRKLQTYACRQLRNFHHAFDDVKDPDKNAVIACQSLWLELVAFIATKIIRLCFFAIGFELGQILHRIFFIWLVEPVLGLAVTWAFTAHTVPPML